MIKHKMENFIVKMFLIERNTTGLLSSSACHALHNFRECLCECHPYSSTPVLVYAVAMGGTLWLNQLPCL